MSFLIHFFMLFALLFGTTVFASVGKVSLLKGEATLQREAQKISLKNGTVLEEKDIIVTAKDAQIQLVFEDKTVITLGSESELKIEEYLNDAAKPKAKFKFGEGSFKSITGQIGKTAPENFTLETKTATIGIRGTTIQGNVGRGGDTIACLSGTITVGAIGSPNVVVVPAGKSTFVAPGTPPTPPQSITPQSITPQNAGTPPPNGNPPPANGDTPPPQVQNFTSISNKSNDDMLDKSIVAEAARLAEAAQPALDTIAQTSSNPDAYGLKTNYAGSTPLNPSATLNAFIDSSAGTTVRDSSNNLYVLIPDSLSDSEHTDTGISWGYWMSDTENITDQKNTWIAGIKTPTSVIDALIHNSANYSYTGKVIGSALASDGTTIGYILNDTTNAINLNISFGSSIINGSINFKTSDHATWVANSFNLSSFGNTGFNGSFSNGNIAGSIKGAFFGSAAQYVGGVFDASKTNGDKVIGTFKALK